MEMRNTDVQMRLYSESTDFMYATVASPEIIYMTRLHTDR